MMTRNIGHELECDALLLPFSGFQGETRVCMVCEKQNQKFFRRQKGNRARMRDVDGGSECGLERRGSSVVRVWRRQGRMNRTNRAKGMCLLARRRSRL